MLGEDSDATVVLAPGKLTENNTHSVAVHLPSKVLEPLLTPVAKQLLKEVARGKKFAGVKGGPKPTVAAPEPSLSPTVDCAKAKCIALTFDDGPSPENTPGLLATLAKEHVHVTFFTIGQHVAAHPELVKQEIQQGHVVGIHTWTHPDLRKRTPAQIVQEIQLTKDAITKASGESPSITRPPYGAVNPKVTGILKSLGQSIILWDVDTEDWKNKNAEMVYQNAIKGAHRGSIILMHDIHPYAPTAAPRIIAELRKQGFVFVTVPQLLKGQLTPGIKFFNQHSHR